MHTASLEEDYFVPHMQALVGYCVASEHTICKYKITERGLPGRAFYFALNEQS